MAPVFTAVVNTSDPRSIIIDILHYKKYPDTYQGGLPTEHEVIYGDKSYTKDGIADCPKGKFIDLPAEIRLDDIVNSV